MTDQTQPAAGIDEARLTEAVARIVAACAPQQIILFGSRVYGRPMADSDMDVLVVVSDRSPDRFELARRAYGALRDLHLPIELHFCKASTFDRYSSVVGSFYREAKTRGRVVYAA